MWLVHAGFGIWGRPLKTELRQWQHFHAINKTQDYMCSMKYMVRAMFFFVCLCVCVYLFQPFCGFLGRLDTNVSKLDTRFAFKHMQTFQCGRSNLVMRYVRSQYVQVLSIDSLHYFRYFQAKDQHGFFYSKVFRILVHMKWGNVWIGFWSYTSCPLRIFEKGTVNDVAIIFEKLSILEKRSNWNTPTKLQLWWC